jgi:hypothetical protein
MPDDLKLCPICKREPKLLKGVRDRGPQHTDMMQLRYSCAEGLNGHVLASQWVEGDLGMSHDNPVLISKAVDTWNSMVDGLVFSTPTTTEMNEIVSRAMSGLFHMEVFAEGDDLKRVRDAIRAISTLSMASRDNLIKDALEACDALYAFPSNEGEVEGQITEKGGRYIDNQLAVIREALESVKIVSTNVSDGLTERLRYIVNAKDGKLFIQRKGSLTRHDLRQCLNVLSVSKTGISDEFVLVPRDEAQKIADRQFDCFPHQDGMAASEMAKRWIA